MSIKSALSTKSMRYTPKLNRNVSWALEEHFDLSPVCSLSSAASSGVKYQSPVHVSAPTPTLPTFHVSADYEAKNTFIHFAAVAFPAMGTTKSAPNPLSRDRLWTLDDCSSEGSSPANDTSHEDAALLEPPVGRTTSLASYGLGETPRPLMLQQRSTFSHFEEESAPSMTPIRTDSDIFFLSTFNETSWMHHTGDGEMSPAPSFAGSDYSCSSADSPIFFGRTLTGASCFEAEDEVDVILWRGQGLDRHEFAPPGEVTGQSCVRLSTTALACRSSGVPNLGAQLHAQGRCVPCLMQSRWNAGKCKEECKFGLMCNRCHEPHCEEELQRIQNQMKKARKNRGGKCPNRVF